MTRTRSDTPGYSAAHARVRGDRGKASAHRCADCGGAAEEWSYDHADPDALTAVVGGRIVEYSADPLHYDPRCRSCHFQFDRPVAEADESGPTTDGCGTYGGAQKHQRKGEKPCLPCRRARNDYVREWRNRKATA